MDNDWTAWRDRCLAAEAKVRELEVMVARMWEGHAAQTGHYNAEHCRDAECEVRGSVDCPHGEELHYHHDGCPACDMEAEQPIVEVHATYRDWHRARDTEDPNDIPFPGPDCSATEHVAGCRHYTEVADYSKLGTVDLPEPRPGTYIGSIPCTFEPCPFCGNPARLMLPGPVVQYRRDPETDKMVRLPETVQCACGRRLYWHDGWRDLANFNAHASRGE